MSRDSATSSWDELARRYGVWIVSGLAIAASLTSLTNGFALDDVRVIARDSRIHSLSGLWHVFSQSYYVAQYGASLYRPLASLFFGLQWTVGHGSPLLFHVVSILLNAAVSVAVYRLAEKITDSHTGLAAAAIFAVHPVHVEAVANIVGQAELATALICIIAVSNYLSWSRSGSVGVREITLLCAMYAAALMFKEHAVVLPALLIATEMLPSPGDETFASRVWKRWPLMMAMAIVAAAFIAVRTSVSGQLAGAGNQAGVFVSKTFGVRLLTMLPVVLHWIRLFVWPASLSADYSAPQIDVQTEFTAAMVPAVAVIVTLIAIAIYLRKNRPAVTFGLSWTAITLLIPSNLIVVTGFVLAERALYLPSVGVSLLLGMGIVYAARQASAPARKLVVAGVAVVLVAGLARSSFRNRVWRDNETLFRQTVEDAPLSWKAHSMLGELLVTQGKGEGILEMSLGVKLARKNDHSVRYLTARRLHESGRQAFALPFYQEALALDPANTGVREDLAYCLVQLGKVNEAIAVAKGGLQLKPEDHRLLDFLKYADSVQVAGNLTAGAVN